MLPAHKTMILLQKVSYFVYLDATTCKQRVYLS